MQIQTGNVIKMLSGKAYVSEDKELTLGMVIAEALSLDQTGGKMKAYVLAEKAFSNKEIEVDTADLSMIKKAIESCKTYNNIVLGQALSMLEEVK